MRWCRIGQKSPVEFQHAQLTAELAGGHGTLSRGFVTKEGDLGCSEDAFRRVVRISYLRSSSRRDRGCRSRSSRDREKIVQVCEAEDDSSQ